MAQIAMEDFGSIDETDNLGLKKDEPKSESLGKGNTIT